jgi:hypothetical protein
VPKGARGKGVTTAAEEERVALKMFEEKVGGRRDVLKCFQCAVSASRQSEAGAVLKQFTEAASGAFVGNNLWISTATANVTEMEGAECFEHMI